MKVNLVNENFSNNYLKNLLAIRGILDVNEYLDPPREVVNDPFNLDNMANGIELLDSILNAENSKILVVVDSDVDGYTSAAIIYNYIHLIAPNQPIDYLLHEHKEHGLQDHYEALLNNDTTYDLIILPDSSSNDYEYHELIGERGTKFLILDHHEIDDGQQISKYACIINNQLSPRYTNKDLTGAGVTWQFCRGHAGNDATRRIWAATLIDLAALGVCGDMGSVLDLENRYIMKNGFENINNYFFSSAVEKQSYSIGGEVNPTTVAFYIVPMMNALIRVGTMEEKERLFLGLVDGHRRVPCNKRGAAGTTEEVAIESLRECTNAKAKQARIVDQMVDKLEQKIYKHDLLDNKILFVRLDDDDDFPPEINGLIAMKLAARFKHPTIVARLNPEGYDRGSIRNVADCELTDLKAFLNDSGYFEWVQGHANAAGASILDSNLRAFHEYANQALNNIDFNEEAYDVNFIREADSSDLFQMVYELGSHPEIWGQKNPEATICVKNIYVQPDDIRIMGANKDTVKITVNGMAYMKFHAANMIKELEKCNEIKMNIVGRANINEWMGNITPQIFIESYEIIDSLLEF